MSCATAMGVVGIWCMHFIGNRAIILGDGSADIQLSYSPGFTVLSVFCPILGLGAAFSAAEWPSKSALARWVALGLTGLLAGGSIVAMHYVGNLGIKNYVLTYSPEFLVASVVIAEGDCIAVLILFYTLREQWISSWWKRLLCAALLAGGVSAMHFTASTHCTYKFVQYSDASAIASRNVQVIIAGTICGAAALIILFILFAFRMRSKALKARSQKVTLACVIFDPSGRILVTTEGVLPSREITDKYNHRTFDEDFNTAHPVYQWIFRVTYNWTGVSDLVPRMRRHLGTSKECDWEELQGTSSTSSSLFSPETYSNYTIIFRERFCIAAASLAASMNIPLERIGVLYDRIVETGTLPSDKFTKRGSRSNYEDVEAALYQSVFGKGQVMFITREASEGDVDKFLNAGYRFASVTHVSRTLAQAMQVPVPVLELHLSQIKRYIETIHHVEKVGTWLTFFALIPKPNQKGFDVAVNKDCQDQLPDVQLLTHRPEQWQLEVLRAMDGYRLGICIAFLDDQAKRAADQTDIPKKAFVANLRMSISRLMDKFPPEWTLDARFCSQQLSAHYSRAQPNRAATTTLFAFTTIVDMHAVSDTSARIARIPLSFFEIRQRCYPGSPDHAILAKDILHMFGPLIARGPAKRRLKSKQSIQGKSSRTGQVAAHGITHSVGDEKPHFRPTSQQSSADNVWSDTSSSLYELIESPRHDTGHSNMRGGPDKPGPNAWGGILVSSETVIESDSSNEARHGRSASLELGTQVDISAARPEVTFVDQLVAITKARCIPTKPDASTEPSVAMTS